MTVRVKYPLTKAMKKKWLEALRSGEYEQGKELLKESFHGSTTYCCLGVLREVAPLKETAHLLNALNNTDRMGADGCSEIYYRLSSDVQEELAGMNDSGETFLFIANYIEKNVEAK